MKLSVHVEVLSDLVGNIQGFVMVENVLARKRTNGVRNVLRNAKEKIARRTCATIVPLGVNENVGRMYFAMIV